MKIFWGVNKRRLFEELTRVGAAQTLVDFCQEVKVSGLRTAAQPISLKTSMFNLIHLTLHCLALSWFTQIKSEWPEQATQPISLKTSIFNLIHLALPQFILINLALPQFLTWFTLLYLNLSWFTQIKVSACSAHHPTNIFENLSTTFHILTTALIVVLND